jgi:hypothetical protein
MGYVKIDSWLANGMDWNEGVMLYNQYGTSPTLKTFFGLGKNPVSLRKLTEALREVNTTKAEAKAAEKVLPRKNDAAPSVAPPPLTLNDFIRIHPLKNGPIDLSDLPDKLMLYRTKQIAMIQQASMLQARLVIMTSDEERKAAMEVIHENHLQVIEIWRCLDEWATNKRLTLPSFVEPNLGELTTEQELQRERKNLIAHISKLKDKPHQAEYLKSRQERLDAVEKILKNAGIKIGQKRKSKKDVGSK